MKELPDKYYLSHFLEFLTFINGPCRHLLDEQDIEFINLFSSLPEDAQCLFVRGQNRKSAIIKTASLNYAEIANVDSHLQRLLDSGFYTALNDRDLNEVLPILTKAQLISVLKAAQLPHKSSDPKATVMQQVSQQCRAADFGSLLLPQHLVKRGFEQQTRYFLFLFFGNLYSDLTKFSMRDMGIMATKTSVNHDVARFDYIDEAKSAFFYASMRREVYQLSEQQIIEFAERAKSFPDPIGTLANANCDRFYQKLGKACLAVDIPKAIGLLEHSNEPSAQERVIRERYKLGDKDWVKQRLEQIIDEPESESLLTFAEDFLSRKFKQKRTSILTDMLREKSTKILLDEMHMNGVEHGVKTHYQKQGVQAFRTENRFWRALFGLVFWHELFEIDQTALITEFDFKPQTISQNCFYQHYQQAIETRLYRLTSGDMAFRQLAKVMTEKYGTANGIFRWHRSILEVLAVFFDHVNIDSVKHMLRAMATDFKTYGDGFPDIMVVDCDGLRFEEIKAPGDQLRKNQLLTIRALRRSGFTVSITQVEWFIDPQQPYAVVDIETTGGRAGNHRITEIGIAKVIGNKVIDNWQTLLNPQRLIPKSITNLTGIDNQMVADAPLFVEIADKLREYLTDCVFVAHNVNFDYGFIRAEFERLEQPFSMPKLCTVREMRKAMPGLPSYSLANLTNHLGIEMSRHHRALSDAQAAAELLFIINEHRLQGNEQHS